MNKLKTQRASNNSPNNEWLAQVNKSTELPTKKGQKLQSTVRFEAETYREVEMIQETIGVSFAETVRKLVKEGLDSFNERNNRQVMDELEELLSTVSNSDLEEAIIKTQEAILENRRGR